MADFTTAFTTGATSEQWLDPAETGGLMRPSRLNARVGHPHTRWTGKVGTQITVSAIVGGVTAPLDTALGGRLFSAWFVQSPEPGPWVMPESPVGQSSVRSFYPKYPGHYVVGFYRAAGGIEHIHMDVR